MNRGFTLSRARTAILICLSIAVLLCATGLSACDGSKGKDLQYSEVDGGYACRGIGQINATGSVIIPSEYEGKPVVSIAENAFYYSYNLTSIEIPDSVTSIGEKAFARCSSLTSIKIPDGESISNLHPTISY